MKVIQFTHTDLDGVACAIVARQYFGRSLKTYFCNYNEVDDTMRTVLGELKESGKHCTIIISDLAYSEECTDITFNLLSQHDVIIADHHKSHLWMNDVFGYKHTCIVDESKFCGAYLLKKVLSSKYRLNGDSYRLSKFVEYVNQWDTWAWTNVPKYRESIMKNIPLMLANAHGMLGNKLFIADIEKYLTYQSDNFLSESHIRKTNAYSHKQVKIVEDVLSKYEFRWVKTDAYGWLKLLFLQDTEHFQSIISEYSTPLMDDDTSFVMIVEPECASLRKPTSGIDLSIIASQFGGGGHPFAAGGVDYEGNKEKFLTEEQFNCIETEKEA